jgi:hypothetical protein
VNRKPYERVNPVRDREAYDDYLRRHPYCQFCGVPAGRAPWPGLSRHHVVKFRRSDERCNLLVGCQRDHDLAELRAVRVGGVLLPKLTLGVCLSVKRERDPANWDPARLAELFGRALPDPEPIPEFLRREWRRWRTGVR